MDKSFIIRIYKQDKEAVSGVVEDIEQNERNSFSDANQLWSLITRTTGEKENNVIKPSIFNAGRTMISPEIKIKRK